MRYSACGLFCLLFCLLGILFATVGVASGSTLQGSLYHMSAIISFSLCLWCLFPWNLPPPRGGG